MVSVTVHKTVTVIRSRRAVIPASARETEGPRLRANVPNVRTGHGGCCEAIGRGESGVIRQDKPDFGACRKAVFRGARVGAGAPGGRERR